MFPGEPVISNEPIENSESASREISEPYTIQGTAVQEDREPIDPIKRSEILEAKIREYLAQGYRLESQSTNSATVIKGHSTNHFIHLIMFIITSTFWWPVWLYFTIKNKITRRQIYVNEYGDISDDIVKK